MDPDFLRELIVLLSFIGLYIGVAVVLLRGHHVDLSSVSAHAVPVAGGGDGKTLAPRLNRRRKAIARDAARKALDAQGPSSSDDNAE